MLTANMPLRKMLDFRPTDEDMAMLDEALDVMGPLEYGSSRIQNSHAK